MTIKEQLHRSATHRKGFDPNCPRCLEDHGTRVITPLGAGTTYSSYPRGVGMMVQVRLDRSKHIENFNAAQLTRLEEA